MQLIFIIFLIMGVAIIIVTHPFTVLLHELGHAIPAILLTRKKVTVYIGSYGDTTKNFKFRIGLLEIWVKKTVFWRTGMCVPSATDVSVPKRIIYIVCGPLASLTFALVGGYYVFAYDMHGSLKMILIFFMLPAIYDLLTNVLPSRPVKLYNGNVAYNDGYLLRKLFYLKKFDREYEIAAEMYNQKEYDKCAIKFRKFLSKGFENEGMYRLAYTSYLMNKEYQQAYQLLIEFEDRYQFDSDDYYNFGLVCSSLNLKKEEVEYYEKSLALNPENPYSNNAIGYNLNTQNKFFDSIPYLNKAIEAEPTLAYAYNNRGHAKIELGQFDEGLADITYSLQLDKENAYAYRNMGIYYLKLSQLEDAKRFLLKAKEMDESTELIEELLAETLAKR